MKDTKRQYGCGTLVLIGFAAFMFYAIFLGQKRIENADSPPPIQAVDSPTPQPSPTPRPSPKAVRKIAPTPAPTPRPSPAMQYWPSTVHTAAPMLFHAADMEHGVRKMTDPSGTEITVLKIENGLIYSQKGDLKGEIAVGKTDFWKQAADKQAAAERRRADDEKKAEAIRVAAQIAQQKELDSYGPEPPLNDAGLFGFIMPPAMKQAILRSLKDPDSFQPREAYASERTNLGGIKCWKVTLRFSARNGFGGMTEGVAAGYMRNDELLDIEIK